VFALTAAPAIVTLERFSMLSRALPVLRCLPIALLLLGLLDPSGSRAVLAAPGPTAPATEVRALWVVRDSIISPASITHVVDHAVQNGFNTLMVQVRGRGDAYFGGGLEPRAPLLDPQPATFDPLATILDTAHRAGLAVHAWVSVNLVASANVLPASHDSSPPPTCCRPRTITSSTGIPNG
jgi:uncharacterized lipoprotein YddW (UPF0748 family)